MGDFYKLFYLPEKEYGSIIKLVLEYINVKFENHPIKYADLPQIDMELLNNLPLLELGGTFKVKGILPILRHLQQKYGCHSKECLDSAESIAQCIQDFDVKVNNNNCLNDNDEVTDFLSLITDLLNKNKNGFLTESGVTFMDFYAAEKLEHIMFKFDEYSDQFPEILAFIRTIFSLSKIEIKV
uniref:GST N-terminal domain-containing protein n=1 Tax=Rhabditophanes sp. KR3021 TaxID=114890 RepID=A0AC35UDT4_9BILA